jgi:hypothetical protein
MHRTPKLMLAGVLVAAVSALAVGQSLLEARASSQIPFGRSRSRITGSSGRSWESGSTPETTSSSSIPMQRWTVGPNSARSRIRP